MPQILSTYPSLTPPDLEAAWDYVAANREELEQAIRENDEGDRRPRGVTADAALRGRVTCFSRGRGTSEYGVTTMLTAQEDGKTAMPDAVILARAIALGRVFLTHNRRHYVRLYLRRGGARRHSDRIAGFRSSGPGQSDRRKACEPISWPMVLPREPAAVNLNGT